MRKIIAILFASIFIISACEKDDFCTQNPVTPKLILRFYNDADRSSTKDLQRFSIWAENKDTISEFTSVSNVDSIYIPLNPNLGTTVYNLKINTTDGKTADNQIVKLTIDYTPNNIYVSRSCGFKVTYNNVTFNPELNSWIKDISAQTSTIDNQNKAHVQIFH